MTIAKITKAFTRTYSDNGQVTTYIEWTDARGKAGCTEGRATNPHMAALLARAEREGVHHTKETW